MATYTNYSKGTRGIGTKSLGTVWLDPGQTSPDIADDDLSGPLPDLGKPGDVSDAAASSLADALAANDDLTAQIAERDATIASQAEQIEALTAPAKNTAAA